MHERINRTCGTVRSVYSIRSLFPETFEPVNLPPQSMPAAAASAFFSAMLEMIVSGVRCVRCVFKVDEINGLEGRGLLRLKNLVGVKYVGRSVEKVCGQNGGG